MKLFQEQLMLKILETGKGIKYLAAYVFFLSVTTIRFFSESNFSSFPNKKLLIFHHHYWFLFVFLLFMLNFRIFLKLSPHKTVWTAILSPVILLPILYNVVVSGGARMRLNYLSALDFPNYLKDVATFMIFSERNSPISVELIVITASIFVFSYYITRKPVRSFFCAISCYLCVIILGGTAIIASQKPEFTLIVVNSSFKMQNFFSFLYMGASIVTASVVFSKEIAEFFKEKRRIIVFLTGFLLVFTALQIYLINPTMVDRIFMIFHSALISLFITSVFYLKKEYAVKSLFLIQIIVSMGVLLPALNQ